MKRRRRAAADKRYYERHKKRILARMKGKYERTRVARLAQMKTYRQTFPGRLSYIADIENRRAKRRGLPGRVTCDELRAIYEAAGGRCHWCGEQLNGRFHFDHVTALADGGGHAPGNLVVACPGCNQRRGGERGAHEEA